MMCCVSPWEFHWESQSLTRHASATGQRYIQQAERGSRVMLFVREESRRGGVTLPFLCLGFADYVRVDGDSLAAAPGDSGGVRAGVGVVGLRGAIPFRPLLSLGLWRSAMALAIELNEEQSRALAEVAGLLNVSQEVLASAAVRDLLSRPSTDFEAAVSNVLAKNAELYRRLA
jgi:hypothetical protein